VRFCLGEDTFWFVPGWNVGKYYGPNPGRFRDGGSLCARKMHPWRIVRAVKKSRLDQHSRSALVAIRTSSSDGPGVA
jgi:hypothetical protein